MDGTDALVARLRAAGCVFAEDEAEVLRSSALDPTDLEAMTARRVAGEPLEHVVGWALLCGVRVGVEPGVFVPRQRSALLARTGASLVVPGNVVVDLCCGSGALGLVVATLTPGVEVHACDVDQRAVACASRNLAPVGGTAYAGDLYDALPARLRGTVSVVVANVPYVPSRQIATLPHDARDHEPRATLDGGIDGLEVARRAVTHARDWLRRNGSILVETTPEQADVLVRWSLAKGGDARTVTDDERDATGVVTTLR